MKQYSSFIICILTVAALLANFACSSKPTEEPFRIEIIEEDPGTKLEDVPHSFHCSHKVGSTTSAEDTIKLTYKIGTRVVIDYTITTRTNGGLTIKGNGIQPSISQTADTLELCWEEDKCFEATKNRNGTWKIKRLPFVATSDKNGQFGNSVNSSPEEEVSFRGIGRRIDKVSRELKVFEPGPMESLTKILRKGDKIPSFNSEDCQLRMFITWKQSTIGEVKNEIEFRPDGKSQIILKDGTRYTSPEGCTIRDFTIISGSLIVNKPK